MAQTRSDQDSPWKEILRQYFQQAMLFFFPETAELIDWKRPHEFLDKEFVRRERHTSEARASP